MHKPFPPATLLLAVLLCLAQAIGAYGGAHCMGQAGASKHRMVAAHLSGTAARCSPCPGHRQPVLQALQWAPRGLCADGPSSASPRVRLLMQLLLLASQGVAAAASGLSHMRLLGGGHWSEAHSCGQRAGAPPAAAVAQLAAQARLRLGGPRRGLAGCLGV